MGSDLQLGADLRLRRPAAPVSRQVLESMVRDLVGGDLSLQAPLLHLVSRPAFLALDPCSSSLALRLLGRDQLLGDLQDTYHPRVLARLREVLDGYLELTSTGGSAFVAPDLAATELVEPPASLAPVPPQASPSTSAAPTPLGPSHAVAPLPAGSGSLPASVATAAGDDSSWSAPGASLLSPTTVTGAEGAAAAQPPGPVASDSPPSPQAGPLLRASGLRLWLMFGAVVLGGTALGLANLRPPYCSILGLCGSQSDNASSPVNASSRALAAGEKASRAMRDAPDVPAFEHALADLDRELMRLSGDPLSQAQQRQRDALEVTARDGQQRLRRERQQADSVTAAAARLNRLDALPAEQQQLERITIRKSLEAIPANSLSHADAIRQLRLLGASPPAAPTRPSASASVDVPSPVDAPQRRASPGGSWSGGSDSWSPPAPSPARAPQDAGDSNAPYRDDPLF